MDKQTVVLWSVVRGILERLQADQSLRFCFQELIDEMQEIDALLAAAEHDREGEGEK